MSITSKLLVKVVDAAVTGGRKVTVVGAGQVGMAIATTILMQNITNELCIVDTIQDKVKGETMDLQHASLLLNHAKITQSQDFSCSKDSALGIITAGARLSAKHKPIELLKLNANIIKDIIPKFVEQSPNAKIIMITTPVDPLTYLAWKVSCLPVNQIFGTGTSLDSCRFRVFLSERLGVSPHAVKAMMIGTRGQHLVPCWSSVSVAGTNLQTIYPQFGCEDDPDKWYEIKEKVIKTGLEVISKKGGTWWAIALCASHLTKQVLSNSLDISAVTTNVKGMHNLEEDVFLSLPCVLGSGGVEQIVNQPLSRSEYRALHEAAKDVLKMQEAVDNILKN